jgi:hypothetical protein
MYSDRRYDLVSLCVDDANVVGISVDDVNLILLPVRGYSGRIGSYIDGLDDIKAGKRARGEVDDTDGVAFTVRDVGILAIERAVVGQGARPEIPPAETTGYYDEEE